MGVEVGRRVAAGELADALVADLQGAALGSGGKALRTAQAEHLPASRHEHALDPRRTEQPLRCGGLDRTVALHVAGAGLDRRSRGNVRAGGVRRSRGNVQGLGVDVDDHDCVVVDWFTGQRLEVGRRDVHECLDPVRSLPRSRFVAGEDIHQSALSGSRSNGRFDRRVDHCRLLCGKNDADPYHPVSCRLGAVPTLGQRLDPAAGGQPERRHRARQLGRRHLQCQLAQLVLTDEPGQTGHFSDLRVRQPTLSEQLLGPRHVP